MGFREMVDGAGAVLDGDELTGRQAAIFIGFWMLLTALIGINRLYYRLRHNRILDPAGSATCCSRVRSQRNSGPGAI